MNKNRVSFCAMGGLGEIGLNCYLYNIFDDNNSEYFMVDLGMGFKDHHLSSIDIFYPDISGLEQYKKNIKGLLITHGHEDHIGAIPHVWQYLQCPIYATAFTADLIREKLKEYKLDSKIKIVVVQPDKFYSIGKGEFKWIQVDHSIPDCHLIYMKTPLGNLVHSGDFKINFSNKPLLKNLSSLKKENIEYLFCDSTNVLEEGISGEEILIKKDLKMLISKAQGVCWITAFSSNVERLSLISGIAKELKKKIVLFGRSLSTYGKLGIKYNYLDSDAFISEEDSKHFNRKDLIFMVTGSQGEERSVLSSVLIMGSHRQKMAENDCVIFASRVIPGNENKVIRLYNLLALNGIDFYTAEKYKIHVSGHPKREELKEFYKMINPQCIIPMHGEAMHLREHSEFVMGLGYKSLTYLNGDVVELFTEEEGIIGEWQTGKLVQDGGRLINFNENFLKARSKMFYEGSVFITMILKQASITNLKTSSLGLFTEEEEEVYNQELAGKIIKTIEGDTTSLTKAIDQLSEDVRITARRYFRDKFNKKPIVKVHLIKS
ncbi:Ribonuclease J 1 [Candidatus Hepatincolaceae symbiont of Richtersius coronifer]